MSVANVLSYPTHCTFRAMDAFLVNSLHPAYEPPLDSINMKECSIDSPYPNEVCAPSAVSP